ncbi:MAG: acyltransferase [Alphaproteobacteria bacterium]|nr:acyltransferase [Alphaproteobacteria bacterium]
MIAAPEFNAKLFTKFKRVGDALAYTGRISYHLYLFHYPLIVFSLYVLQRDMTLLEKLAVIALTFILSVLSYSFIERPIRNSKDAGFVKKMGFAGLLAVVVLSGFGAYAYTSKGIKGRFEQLPDGLLDGVYAHLHPRHAECMDLDVAGYPDNLCRIGDEKAAPDIMLWGDSHALMYMPVLEDIAREEGRTILVAGYSNCPPIPGLVFHEQTGQKSRANCPAHNKAVMDYLVNTPEVKTVVLGGFWLRRIYPDPGVRYPTIKPDYILEKEAADTDKERVEQFFEALSLTIQTLQDVGKHVVLIGPIPTYDFNVPQRLGHVLLYGNNKAIGISEMLFMVKTALVKIPMRDIVAENQISFIDPLTALCHDGFCYAAEDDQTYYADKSHMERQTTMRLKPDFIRALSE